MSKQITLALTRKTTPTRMDVVQYATAPDIIFNLEDYTPGAGAAARLYIEKPDGTEVYNDCTINGNQITYTPTTQSFAVPGINRCQLEITEASGVAVSFLIFANVTENIIDSSAIESKDEFTALQEALQTVSEFDGRIEYVEENYLPLSGGTLTGNLAVNKEEPGVSFTDENGANAYIKGLPGGRYGQNLLINPGGNLIMGGGEYAQNRYDLDLTESTTENTYIGADGALYLESNANSMANRKTWTLDTSGNTNVPNNIVLPNGRSLSINTTSGEEREVLTINGSNNTALGNGSFTAGEGETYVLSGTNIINRAKKNVYIQAGSTSSAVAGQSWAFGSDGTVTMPSGGKLNAVTGAGAGTQIADKSLASGTDWTNIGSFSLAKGTWLVMCNVSFASNATGRRQVNLSATSAGNQIGLPFRDNRAAVNGQATDCKMIGILSPTATTTYYVNGVQNSGSALTVSTRYQLVRLA